MMAFESVLYVCGGRGKGGVDNGVLRNKAKVVPLLQEQPRQQKKGLSVIVVFAVLGRVASCSGFRHRGLCARTASCPCPRDRQSSVAATGPAHARPSLRV